MVSHRTEPKEEINEHRLLEGDNLAKGEELPVIAPQLTTSKTSEC